MSPFVSGCLLPLVYVVLATLPILLKLFDAPRFVPWSWWRTTSLLWGPWLLVAVFAALGWLVRWVQNRRARARG